MTPKISVVMPFYNGEKFLKEAIESILNQTFSDFELILINDGSSDRSLEIVNSFSDPRITVLDNHSNWGLSRSFNRGIQAARGKYIARMDADDVALKDRFRIQYEYLESNPQIGVLGSAIILMDKKGKLGKKASRPLAHHLIKWQSLFSNPIFHPTVMARAEILKNNPFDESIFNSEDYELWSRLLFTTDTKFANLSTPTLRYRVFSSSFTQSLKASNRAASGSNTIRNIEKYIPLTTVEKTVLSDWKMGKNPGMIEMRRISSIYIRSAAAFKTKEGLGSWESLRIYFSLFNLKIFLFKNLIKRFAPRRPLW